jgi:hypothetical protein
MTYINKQTKLKLNLKLNIITNKLKPKNQRY